MAKARLTDLIVRTASCPPGKDRREWWDSISTGLVLRVTESSVEPDGRTERPGTKSWYAIYRSPITGKQTKLRLGDVKLTDAANGLTLSQARIENIQVQSEVSAGRDPRIDREQAQAAQRQRLATDGIERAQATFRGLADDYLAEKRGLRSGTLKCYRSALDRELLPMLGDKLVRDLTALDFEVVVERVAKRRKRARARTVKTALGSIWSWARRTAKWRALGITRDLVAEINPELTTKGEARRRKLTDEELRELWGAVEASNLRLPTKIAFKLTMLLGERATELIHAPWSEFALDGDPPRWTLPAERNNGKSEKTLPLPPMAAALLRELKSATGHTHWLIPGRDDDDKPANASLLTGSIRHLRDQGLLTCSPFTPHDLRRTMANRMAEELEVSGEAIKAVLGHSRSDVTSVHYTQNQQLRMKLAALTAWERRLREILGLEPTAGTNNIVELKRA
jgi:integrase